MNTSPQRAHDSIAALERAVLQDLAAHRDTVPQEAWKLLGAYRFALPLHQVVFEVLRELGPTPAGHLRVALIEQLTRRGFPDVDLSPFFTHAPAPPERILLLVWELCKTADPGETRPAGNPSNE